jgi:PAS domain S-box-containing protein
MMVSKENTHSHASALVRLFRACQGVVVSLAGRIFENELMRDAMQVARVGLCITDADHEVILLSGDFAEKLELSAEILVGKSVRGIFESRLLLDRAAQVLSVDAPETAAEARIRRADGRDAILMFQARTLDRGEDGRYRVLTLVDITEFGITRDHYLELRHQLDALNTAMVVVDIRPSGMPIVYVNRRFEQITGYSAEEAVGQNCRFLQGNDREQPGLLKLRQAIALRQSCHVVLRNYRKDGSPFHNELLISPVYDECGEVIQYIGLQREVNDRHLPASNWVGGA